MLGLGAHSRGEIGRRRRLNWERRLRNYSRRRSLVFGSSVTPCFASTVIFLSERVTACLRGVARSGSSHPQCRCYVMNHQPRMSSMSATMRAMRSVFDVPGKL
jgi:hypothetical protein